jgi:hypothetical protein
MRLVERLEQGRFPVVDASGRDISVQIRFRFVVQPPNAATGQSYFPIATVP